MIPVIYCMIFSLSNAFVTNDLLLKITPVKPSNNQTYLCTAFEMPRDDHFFIVGLQRSNTTGLKEGAIHHSLLFGCTIPGFRQKDSQDAVWNCGDREDPEIFDNAHPCQEGQQILSEFINAPGVPSEAALMVGKGTDIKYIVLQLHFGNVNAILDSNYEAGYLIKTLPSSTNIPVKVIGNYFLGTDGTIPPHSTVRMESSCIVQDDLNIHAISFSTHTHSLGLQVAAYLKKNATNTWYRLGISDPTTTQWHGLVDKDVPVITKGDVIASRCLMYNSRNQTVEVGYDSQQEMCNFYLHYYTEEGRTMKNKYCYTDGPPNYFWKLEEYMKGLPQWIENDLHLVDYQLEERKKYGEKFEKFM